MRQLQAEVRKLKEQLAQALASPVIECGRDPAPGGPSVLKGKAELFTCKQQIIKIQWNLEMRV